MSESKLEWTELARLVELKTAMSGFPRLMQIMTGQVPSIHTFGILSVDNPQAQTLTPEQNNKRRLEFKDQLRRESYGYVQHGGKYGVFEKAFFVMNCRKDVVLGWGNQYDQESVIFGAVNHESTKVTFEFIEHDVTVAVREVVLSLADDAQAYSICKGRKFQIPFFEEEYAPEKKVTHQQEEFVHDEQNLTHLATLYALADKIKADALGKTNGMAVQGHRYAVQAALKALVPEQFPVSVYKVVTVTTPGLIKTAAIGTDWTTNKTAVEGDSENVWVLSAGVEESDIERRAGQAVTLKKGTALYFTATKQKADPRWSGARFHGKA